MSAFLQDARLAARAFAKSPGFFLVAVATLALTIGANSAVFSVVSAVLLKSLPFAQPDRLVAVRSDKPSEGWEGATSSPPNYFDWRSSNHVFADMAAYDRTRAALTGLGPAQRIQAAEVTASFFSVLGVRPVLGRTFVSSDEERGAPQVVVLSHRLFSERFASNRSVVNGVIRFDGVPYTVVGIMPAGCELPRGSSQAWMPLRFPGNVATQRGAHYLSIIARLRAGVTADQAQREMKQIAGRLAAAYPDKNKGWTVSIKSLRDQLVGSIAPALLILLGAVSLLTLIGCVNVANLLLTRAAGRRSEVATRVALGASPARLASQLFTESLVLALSGATLGVLLAGAGLPLLLALRPGNIPRLENVEIDGRVLLFTAGLTIVTALLFGLVPVWGVLRRQFSAPRSTRGMTAARGEARLHSGLVAAEIAIALTLLAGSSLLIRSFVKLQSVGPGFEPRGVLKLGLDLPQARYPTHELAGLFYQRTLDRIRSIPGVEAAAATFQLPLSDSGFSSSFTIESHPVPSEDEPSAQLRIASRDYFSVMRIPLLRGRLFEPPDAFGSTPIVLATQSAVRRHWPRGDAIGQVVHFGASPGVGKLGGRIVGIIGDIRDDALSQEPVPEFYVPLEQAPADSVTVVVRTTGPPARIAPAVRDQIQKVDPELPVADLETLENVVGRSISQPRFYTLLLSFFGALALLLAAIGVYGVISYGVARRRPELALRIALGASRQEIRGLVVGRAAAVGAAGVVAGLAGSLALTRLLKSLLFGIGSADPASFGAAAALLILVGLAASYFPARRASRVDPAQALRSE